ncbi:MAG: ABC transporter ATP-binding protein [Eubacteriales bacterium]|nr:ABC transporter ATP-binding protein [Eubacteriales bacterium]
MIRCENLVKIYKSEETEVLALQGLDLNVADGEMVCVVGNSGSGKSTLLNMLGGIDKPSAGRLFVDGKDIVRFSNTELIEYKRETVGFVWQNKSRNLIPYMSARQNVELPMILAGKGDPARARELLDMVGLSGHYNSKLAQLSGGEQQRVAIAIALANRPKLLLADEPTGAVDTATAKQIMEVLRRANEETGVTVVIVTHDMKLANQMGRVIAIRDGRTSSEFIMKNGIAMPEFGTQNKEETHDEVIVVDKVGRLQLPGEILEKFGFSGETRVVVSAEEDRIVLTPYKN